MESNLLVERIRTLFSKYKYAAIVLLIGIALILVPTPEKETESQEHNYLSVTEPTVDERLSEILSTVNDAGKVRVFLTVHSGEETIYQTDKEYTNREDSEDCKNTTVIVKGYEKEENGLIRQVNPPIYLGAVVVCEGADKPSVKLAIVDAVSKVTGLGADRISVLKMK